LNYKSILLLLLCYTFASTAFAQQADTLKITQAAYANIQNNFNKALGPQSRLYNGREYNFYPPSLKGTAYFMDVHDWGPGSVFYDGYLYKNVDILYDLYKDELVTPLYKSFLKIHLLNERVKYFDLMGHHFVYLVKDPTNPTSVNFGYYDQLYAGKIQVLARHSKSIQTSIEYTGAINSYFSPSNDYYIFKNGLYYSVNSEGSFLDVLKDRKKELRQFIKANKIKFRKQRENAMAKVAAYYDTLTD
jgi:hypothetical protein